MIAATVVMVIDGRIPKYNNFIEAFNGGNNPMEVFIANDVGFVLFYVLAIAIIYQAHKVIGQNYRMLARTYLLAYFAMAWLQLLSFVELLYFDGQIIKAFRDIGVAAINSGTTLVAFTIAVMAIFMHFSQKQVRGTVWKV